MKSSQAEIESALEAELEFSSRGLPFTIRRVEKEGRVHKLTVTPGNANASLDESLEDAKAWWPGNPSGSATISSVIPEQEQINLVSVEGNIPEPGGCILLYPARYLEPLLALWQDEGIAAAALHWLATFGPQNQYAETKVPESRWFPDLRPRQAQAFKLSGWRTGFLWGPPRYGKNQNSRLYHRKSPGPAPTRTSASPGHDQLRR